MMKKFLYKITLTVIVLALWCLNPIFWLCAFFIPWVKKRRRFEGKNYYGPHPKADFCFEVSSEGELEQVMPLLAAFIQRKKIIELIYSSESVEKKVESMTAGFKGQMYCLRLPLIRFNPFLNWVTADNLILCRYDFYPHLLLLGLKRKKFVLLSASLKGKRRRCKFPYDLFDLIVAASEIEKRSIEDLLANQIPVLALDLRVERILERLKNKSERLKDLSPYLQKLQAIPVTNRIILGSVYPQEMVVFENKDFLHKIVQGKIHVCIAPHKLSKDFIEQIMKNIPSEIKYTLFPREQHLAGVTIMLTPGILCELYSYFGHAFVGGGNGKGVHSLLEPYLAGSQVYSGPKVHRSTEYDFIVGHSPKNISIVTSLKDFYDGLKQSGELPNISLLQGEFFKILNILEE